MHRTRKNPLILTLLILAFATMGISPACAFISGTMMDVEICKPDGSVEIMQIDMGDKSADHHAQNAGDCLFCFAHTNAKTLNNDAPVMRAFVTAGYLRVSSGLIIPQSLDHKSYLPTGPPAALS